MLVSEGLQSEDQRRQRVRFMIEKFDDFPDSREVSLQVITPDDGLEVEKVGLAGMIELPKASGSDR